MLSRLQQLRTAMEKERFDGLFISLLANITYLTGFSGFSTEDRDAFLLITKTKQYIFTHGIYEEVVQKKVKDFTFIKMQRENPIAESLQKLITKHTINKLGFEAFDLTVAEYTRLTNHLNKEMLHPINLIGELRSVKDAKEITAIQKACALGDKAYSHILKKIRMNMTEKELATELEFFIKRHGADISFPPTIAFGANASDIHHLPDTTKLEQNSPVLLDFGVKLNDYCSDMTRTIFFGKATKKQKEVYETVLNAQQTAIKELKQQLNNRTMKQSQSISTQSIDHVARQYIIDKGFPSMPHSLGHGIGLEVHESPRITIISQEVLQEGNVFSIEPGIYLPAGQPASPDNFGVRIEDLFAIRNGELTQLTRSPKKFLEI